MMAERDEFDEQVERLLPCLLGCAHEKSSVLGEFMRHAPGCPFVFRPTVASALREAGHDRMRGNCRMLSIGEECSCGLCDRDKQIAYLRREVERLNKTLLVVPDIGRTHYEGCWRDRGHHACAIAQVERLI